MLQKDDLKQVVSELVEELIGKKSQTDLTPEESDEYYTRPSMRTAPHHLHHFVAYAERGYNHRSQVRWTQPLLKKGDYFTCEIESAGFWL